MACRICLTSNLSKTLTYSYLQIIQLPMPVNLPLTARLLNEVHRPEAPLMGPPAQTGQTHAIMALVARLLRLLVAKDLSWM